ncbi:MAG TPA: HAMP domain-containing sensor histidine kinase [Terriglobales bacterium]|jgi:signal transduction histidine kinase|nr:HAMP domain-containing sensor histidine kinase [Terriglobales bacterium]
MKTNRRNEKTRLLLTLELAVILPAAALVLVSAWHVLHIQRDRAVEAAIQRDFSQVLAISEKQINHKAYELVDDVRADLPTPSEACGPSLDKTLAAYPYAAHIFIYSPETGMVFRSQSDRLAKDAGFREEADYLSKMFDGWLKIDFKDLSDKLERNEKKGSRYLFDGEWVPRGEKKVYQSDALFLIKDPKTGSLAIGGVALDSDYLREHFFPEMLGDVITRNVSDAQTDKNHAVMMLRGKYESTALAQSSGWDGGAPEEERNLEGAFPGLTLAIKLRGTTLAAIGERFARISFLTLAGLSLVLAGGIALTYRNVTKEMALARLKSDFVSNVSHELRTPLSLIRLYAETLEMGRLTSPEKYQEYYRIIRKESERLTALINNILDFSRIEAGRKEYDFRETDMSELVHNTLDSYRYQLEQSGFQFEEKIDDVPPMRVDREAMARSLLNLVNNALKYSQDRKYIGVNLYRDNGSVKLEVVDQGIGIPHQEQQKIFEKFYRVGDPLVHNTKGSGLGLSLVRHIVQAHGGEVSVDSAPGQGSKFTIVLPVKPALHNGTAATA